MTPLTHNQYIKLFSDIAIAHRDINSFYTGDLDNYTANESETLNPVTLWVVINDDTIAGKVDSPKYTFVVLDFVNQDSSNLDEVYSDTLRIAKDVLSILRQPYYETFFKIEEAVTFNPFNEKFDSDVAGWQFELTFNQSFLYDACAANTTGLPSINYETIAISTSNSTWGYIVGTLSNQTDLQAALDAKVPTSRTLTINGTTYDLSANRSWTISGGGETLAQTLALGNTTGGTDLTISSGDSFLFGTKGVAEYSTLDSKITLYNTTSGGILNLFDSGVVSLESLSNNIELNAPFNSIILNGTNVNFSQLTASTVPYLDASKNLVSSAVTPTQLSYLDATSSIQTQLNAKQDTLVSGTNIKTVGGVSLLGAGDIGSISTTYTDAKIKGSVGATSGLIPYGTGTADTVTSNANFSFDGTALLVGTTSLTNATNVADFRRDQNAGTRVIVCNDTSGTSAFTSIVATNSAALSGTVSIIATSALYTASGAIKQDAGHLASNKTNGLVIATTAATSLYFSTNSTQRAEITSGGYINLGTYGSPTAQRLVTIGNASAWLSIGDITTSATSVGLYANQGTPSASNYTFNLTSANTNVNAPTTTLNLQVAAATKYAIGANTHTLSVGSTTGSNINWQLTCANSTVVTASTAIPKVLFTLGSAQWSTGALASTQKFYSITQPAMSFVGASTSTLASTVVIAGAVDASTNATITTSCGLLIESSAVASAGTVTTSYGAYINAMTGGGTNYALGVNGVSNFLGNVRLTQTVTTEAVTSDTTVTIVINGTTYKLLAKA